MLQINGLHGLMKYEEVRERQKETPPKRGSTDQIADFWLPPRDSNPDRASQSR
jgi:hypothetical protein